MSLAALAGISLIALAVGAGLGYWFAHSRIARSDKTIEKIEGEFEAYRRGVTEHFAQTADHFNSLGQEYRALYEHLAKGSDALCLPAEDGNRLPFDAADAAAAGLDQEAVAVASTKNSAASPDGSAVVTAKVDEQPGPLKPVSDSPNDTEGSVNSVASEDPPDQRGRSTIH